MHAAEQTTYRAPRDNAPDAKIDQPAKDRPAPEASTSLKSGEATAPNTVQEQLPCEEQIKAALINTLKSSEFQSAPQLRAFLGFVVHATLNRQQEKIKGYTIAVEALGRPEDFNPVTDPIVRVEAARLRRRLEKYYAGSGANDPVRITIPKGSYAPEFQPAHAGSFPDCAADLAAKDVPEGELAGKHFAPETMALPHLETGGVSGTVDEHDAFRPPERALHTETNAPERTGLPEVFRKLQRALAHPVDLWLVFALCLASFLAGYLSAGL
ncbi:MAG: hypothetical protein RID22_27405 [Roseibium aggregatum]